VNPNDIIDLQGPDLRMIACKQTFTIHVYNRDYESDILSNQKEVWLYRQLSAKTPLIGWLLASHKDTKCTSNSTSNIFTLLSRVPLVLLFWIPSFSSFRTWPFNGHKRLLIFLLLREFLVCFFCCWFLQAKDSCALPSWDRTGPSTSL
jgi:hypothetical protein